MEEFEMANNKFMGTFDTETEVLKKNRRHESARLT